MSRQSRFEFLASVLRPSKAKKVRRVKRVSSGRAPKQWRYAAPPDVHRPGIYGVVTALTRSEARAEIKRIHGINRVPIGTLIVAL